VALQQYAKTRDVSLTLSSPCETQWYSGLELVAQLFEHKDGMAE
jgi:hypothetical protein